VTSPPSDSPGALSSEMLFRLHGRFVMSFLLRHGVARTELDDLVQDVFLSAHRKGGYRPGPASPTTFLARLALEAQLKRRRGEGRAAALDLHEASDGTTGRVPTDPSERLAHKQAALRLQNILEAMEPGQRAVFILFELEGESSEAIAAGLNLPLGTVYSRLHHARDTFRTLAARQDRREATRVERHQRSYLSAMPFKDRP
jgi:RNA polymerase sigma-70 factor (ECF subfamily)